MELYSLGISIEVPENSEAKPVDDGVHFDLNPDGRTIRRFSLRKANHVELTASFPKSKKLKNGGYISYDLYQSEEAGSGGTEYELTGVFELEDKTFLIQSIDQQEFSSGKPEHCFKYLATAKVLAH